ncbi:MAG: cation diffusion facilitator family transporter [Oscillospiraceae bacterium]
MTKLLIRLFIKDYNNVKDHAIRAKYGKLSGAVGIILNLILTFAKFFVGTLSGSISITADAVNNLSDAGSSIITLLGFKMSEKPADDDHPYGHGRIEYVSSLIVSFLVLSMGIELFKSSIDKIRTPVPIEFSYVALVILVVSILAKLWLAYFNWSLGKKINSTATRAVVADSLSDTAATSVALASLIISKFTSVPVDGYFGLIVAGFIFYSGYGILKDTIAPILGKAPDKEFVEEIEQKIMSYDGVIGVHDLIIHDYGPGRNFASAHAEVPANVDILESHDIIDNIEHAIKKEYGMLISIHLDPVIVDDDRIKFLKILVANTINEIDEVLSLHDFRVVEGPTHTNLIFDLVTPRGYSLRDYELNKLICEKLSKIDERYFCVITIEHSFN